MNELRIWYRKVPSPGDNPGVLGWRGTKPMVEPELSTIRQNLERMRFVTILMDPADYPKDPDT